MSVELLEPLVGHGHPRPSRGIAAGSSGDPYAAIDPDCQDSVARVGLTIGSAYSSASWNMRISA